jgi:drug/metabolite transporter (DMT)-like permease
VPCVCQRQYGRLANITTCPLPIGASIATALLSMGLVEPLIAVLLGAAFLDERVTLGAALGGVLVLCSIFMITISFQRSPK